MLTITIDPKQVFDESTQRFITVGGFEIELEHSLVSLSKWESHFKKPFLSKVKKTPEETAWYIQAMVLTPNLPPEIFQRLTKKDYEVINAYIDDKMTATTFNDPKDNKPSREIITAEIIYYWMISFNIPFECQYWHLNRLLTLIKVCSKKNTPPKKMSRREIAARNRMLNKQRRAALGTTG